MTAEAVSAATTVREIMTRNPLCVGPDIGARELARDLEANEISGMPVTDGLDRVIGVVSRTDLLHRMVQGPLGTRRSSFFESLAEGLSNDESHPDNLGTVEDFMTPEPVTAGPDDLVVDVAHRMAEDHIHRIVIVNDGRQVLGIVTTLDLLRVFPR
ncbi:MAG: CBS domain-containing protein [Phycisphaerales bacterium]